MAGALAINASDLTEKDWVKSFLHVPNEQENIVPFEYDFLQERMTNEQTIRDVWVKPRQVRCSSRIMARNVRRVTTGFGVNCLVIGKDDDMIGRFRDRIKMHMTQLEEFGLCPRITQDNDDELVFGDLAGSRFIWASAEQSIAGRSFTAHIVHATEIAHWKPGKAGEILGGILPAVPDPPFGQVDLESTPNGAVGPFYDFAMAARYQGTNQDDSYTLHFIPWWDEPKYTVSLTSEQVAAFHPSEEEQKLMNLHNLTPGQITWRRNKIRDMAKTDTPFEQEYPEDLMGCFLLGGDSYFELEVLKYIHENTVNPVEYMRELPMPSGDTVKFEGWGQSGPGRPTPWIIDGLSIYEHPQPGENYVIFVDPSEGHKKSDNGCIQVLHAGSRRQVAVAALKAGPNKLAEMACAIGYYYNGAMLGIERNRISACVLRAVDLDYPNLYYDVDEEDPTREKRKAGWYTTRDSRSSMLANGKEDVESYVLTIRDLPTVREMFTFTWEHVRRTGDLQWKAQAQAGALDDRIIALLGANRLADRYNELRPTAERTRENSTMRMPGVR